MIKVRVIWVAIVFVLFVWAGAASAVNTVAVTQAAALGPETGDPILCPAGCGLEVTMDGSGNNAHVRESDAHNIETVYTFEFKIDMNNLTMTDLDWHIIATGRREVPSPRNVWRLLVRFREGQVNPYKIRVVCRNDSNAWNQPGGHSLPTSGVSDIKLEWQQSSGVDTNDGFCNFYRNGILRASTNTLDNDTHTLGSLTLGVAQVDAGTVGSQYYDSVGTLRTIAP